MGNNLIVPSPRRERPLLLHLHSLMQNIDQAVRVILLIDDDDDDQAMFREALQAVDDTVRCIVAPDGVDAVEMLRIQNARVPDYIFLDLNMPKMGGKECLLHIRRMPHLQHVPVIIYTTSRQNRDVEETRALGAVHFISKPYYFDDICQSIRHVLEEAWRNPVEGR